MDIKDDFDEKYVSTKYGRIHISVHKGSGTSIVFLHGLGASLKTWSTLIPFLPSEFNICLVEMLGHGDSDAPEIDYVSQVQVDVIKEVVKHEGLSRPVLFGHSYGGWIALRYATDSDDVEKLILEDSAGLVSAFNLMDDAQSEERKARILKATVMSGLKEYVARSILNDETAGSDLLTKEDLAEFHIPALIIWGEKDDILDPRRAEEFAEGFERSGLVIIKNAKHTPHYTYPREVARAITMFLEK